MALQKFKSEGDYFDEDNLHNMLYEYFDNSKYFVNSPTKLMVENVKGDLEIFEGSLSEDMKFLAVNEGDSLNIYSLTTQDKLNKTLSFIIKNFPKLDIKKSIKIDGNIIYFLYLGYLNIIDIKNSTLSKIKTGILVSRIYSYKGNLCLIGLTQILLISVHGVRSSFRINIDYEELEKVNLYNGILYLCSKFKIHTVDIENGTCVIENNVNKVIGMLSLSLGKKFTIYINKLSLPSGKVLNSKDVFPDYDADYVEFYPMLKCNLLQDKLMCTALLTNSEPCYQYMIIVDLNTETISLKINIDDEDLENILEFGFLEPITADLIKPVVLDYNNL
jgi:hypothetical protein